MKLSFWFLLVGLSIFIDSCGQDGSNKNVDEGKVEKNIYTSDEIGWTIEIPKGWTETEREETQAMTEKGLKAMEEVVDGEIDYSRLKNLVGFQKNKFNIFQSTSEPFELEYEGEWEENNEALKDIIYAAYQSQGINVDSTETKIEKIDGLKFYSYSFTVYGPKGEIILKQTMFSRLINGFDFGVNINYNNESDRDEMLLAFRSSKFRKN